MSKDLLVWDDAWLTLDAEELYARCGLIGGGAPPQTASSSFHFESAPYLVATEFPWLRLPSGCIEGRSVLTIAGSGDLPLYFFRLGARRVVGVDVSRTACLFSELKRSVLCNLAWKEAVRFLLADLAPAERFLASRGIPSSMRREERSYLYATVRHDLSPSARGYWDRSFGESIQRPSPFHDFQGIAALSFLDLIPYLASEEEYEAWKGKARAYPLLNLPLQSVVASAQVHFDVLYFSNVLEYWKEDCILQGTEDSFGARLESFLLKAWDVLASGGHLYFYVFSAMRGERLELLLKDLGPLRRCGGREEAFEITYSSPSIPGSRFCNTLLRFHKPAHP